eukprot:353892-Chlamydomonas_euryale.AAC.1
MSAPRFSSADLERFLWIACFPCYQHTQAGPLACTPNSDCRGGGAPRLRAAHAWFCSTAGVLLQAVRTMLPNLVLVDVRELGVPRIQSVSAVGHVLTAPTAAILQSAPQCRFVKYADMRARRCACTRRAARRHGMTWTIGLRWCESVKVEEAGCTASVPRPCPGRRATIEDACIALLDSLSATPRLRPVGSLAFATSLRDLALVALPLVASQPRPHPNLTSLTSWSTSASGSSGPWAWARLSPAGGEPEKVANLLGSDLLDGLRDSGTMSPAAPNSISPCMELLSDLCSLLLRRLREPLAALCPAGRPGSALAPSSSPLMASSMRSTHAAAQLPLPDPGVDLAADSCRVCLRGPGAPSNTLAPYGGAPPLERVLGRAMEPSLGSGSDLLTDDSAHDPDSERCATKKWGLKSICARACAKVRTAVAPVKVGTHLEAGTLVPPGWAAWLGRLGGLKGAGDGPLERPLRP